MRIKRAKKYKKYINYFKVAYKFKPPFKVLVDGNFFHTAVRNGFNLQEQLKGLFGDTVLPVMTGCIMSELEHLPREVVGETVKQAKGLVKEKCKHAKGFIDPGECIEHYINKRNDSKVFVGT